MSDLTTASADDPLVHSFESLRIHELLYTINTALFHPRGFALGLNYPEPVTREQIDAHTVEPDGWVLYGDGTEPFHYVLPDGEADAAFTTFEQFLNDHRPGGYAQSLTPHAEE